MGIVLKGGVVKLGDQIEVVFPPEPTNLQSEYTAIKRINGDARPSRALCVKVTRNFDC